MVHKIRLVIFFLIAILLCFIGLTHKGHIETNLLRTLLPQSVINSTDIASIANKSSSLIKVVFESDNQSNLEKIIQDFNKQIDTSYFEVNRPNVSKILDKYLTQPTNFLSEQTRNRLIDKKYDEIYNKSIESLYNPTGIQLTTLDKDPYLLLDDFILSSIKMPNSIDYLDGKYYDFTSLKFKNDQALSPTLSNEKIKQLTNIQKQLSNQHSKIYLAGAPIHSYYTSTRSIIDINIICILSTLIIIFLTYKYFKNLKLLLPIALSIMFGMLCGYIGTKVWFDNFQVITMVFSTTLIGIGIDYSYHYFFADNIDKRFIKNLSFSLFTTIVPFALLYFTKIELLQQVAVFTVFGLMGIYLVVLFIYPCFKYSVPILTYHPRRNLYKLSLIVLLILSVVGITRFHFNDNLTALYSPSKSLLKAEILYGKISGENVNTQIITVKGDNLNEIIKTEERVTKDLKTDYIALSKFFPSERRQKENFKLVKQLYNFNLNKYSNILTQNQIKNLKNTKFIPVQFDNLYSKDLMLDSNTSMIIIFNSEKLNLKEKNAHIVNFQLDIKHYMTHYRHLLLILFPVVIILLYVLLTCLYDYRNAFKILIPSMAGILCSILLTTLVFGELNLFSVITMFLILGFTIDYSIFRINAEEKTESAIFVSCVTTSFSFLLLALCGFKMLSSMALILFFGIITSYLVGYLLLNNRLEINNE